MSRDSPPLRTSPPDSAELRAGRTAGFATVLTLAAMVVLVLGYLPTARGMVEIWARSDTFAHGFVVPLISAWLAWRHRGLLAGTVARRSAWALVAAAVVGFGWLLGELAEVNALRQFALVGLLILAVPAIAGIDVARRLAFPLGFLLFAVPFGEFLLPRLMEWTATFTVLALKASGIPVYREGLHFVIPSGSWSVVEACSGVRYLIASVMVGTLYAYLTYQRTGKRLAFVGVSFLVPVFANWLRAYMIVMLGHLSGNRLAVGVDHLIYGWVFFGVVMLLMFWVGARWREDEPAPRAEATRTASTPATPDHSGRVGVAIGALAFLVVALIPALAARVLEGRTGAGKPEIAAVTDVPGWSVALKVVTPWRPRYVEPSTERFDTYVSGSREVGVYIAFYRSQTSTRKLVSSENVLVASNDPQWLQTASGDRAATIVGVPESVHVADIAHRSGARLRAWQWYWVDGKVTASPARAKLLTALAQLTGRGDDSAAVVLVTPQVSGPGAAANADAALEAFAAAAIPRISAALQATRDKR